MFEGGGSAPAKRRRIQGISSADVQDLLDCKVALREAVQTGEILECPDFRGHTTQSSTKLQA